MIQRKPPEYAEENKVLGGLLAWDDSYAEPRPGVLVFHDNTGLTDHERDRATRLAELGFVALACGMLESEGVRGVMLNGAGRLKNFAPRKCSREPWRASKRCLPSPKWTNHNRLLPGRYGRA